MGFEGAVTAFGLPGAFGLAIFYVWVNRKTAAAPPDAATQISKGFSDMSAHIEKQDEQITLLRERVARLEGRGG